MKKLLLALCVCMLLLLLFACKGKETTMDTQAQAQTQTTQQTTVEETTQAPQLSETCDKVLADGYDKENNHYELVANEKQDAFGANIEIGVIKNNEWLIPLTNKSPFIGKDGWLAGRNGNYKGSIHEDTYDSYQFEYIGNSCFCYHDIIFNSENGKSFDVNTYFKCYANAIIYEYEDTGVYGDGLGNVVVNEDGKVLLRTAKQELYLLDTSSMKATKIPVDFGVAFLTEIHPFNEGVFSYVASPANEIVIERRGFYNEAGKKVIDLSKYTFVNDITKRSEYDNMNTFVFYDGTCDMYVDNGSGAIYQVKIDKSGKILSQDLYKE